MVPAVLAGVAPIAIAFLIAFVFVNTRLTVVSAWPHLTGRISRKLSLSTAVLARNSIGFLIIPIPAILDSVVASDVVFTRNSKSTVADRTSAKTFNHCIFSSIRPVRLGPDRTMKRSVDGFFDPLTTHDVLHPAIAFLGRLFNKISRIVGIVELTFAVIVQNIPGSRVAEHRFRKQSPTNGPCVFWSVAVSVHLVCSLLCCDCINNSTRPCQQFLTDAEEIAIAALGEHDLNARGLERTIETVFLFLSSQLVRKQRALDLDHSEGLAIDTALIYVELGAVEEVLDDGLGALDTKDVVGIVEEIFVHFLGLAAAIRGVKRGVLGSSKGIGSVGFDFTLCEDIHVRSPCLCCAVTVLATAQGNVKNYFTG